MGNKSSKTEVPIKKETKSPEEIKEREKERFSEEMRIFKEEMKDWKKKFANKKEKIRKMERKEFKENQEYQGERKDRKAEGFGIVFFVGGEYDGDIYEG